MWIKLLCLVPKAFENLSTVDRSSQAYPGHVRNNCHASFL